MPETLESLNSGSSNHQENITFLRPLYFLAAKNPLVGHPSIMHQSGFFPFPLPSDVCRIRFPPNPSSSSSHGDFGKSGVVLEAFERATFGVRNFSCLPFRTGSGRCMVFRQRRAQFWRFQTFFPASKGKK